MRWKRWRLLNFFSCKNPYHSFSACLDSGSGSFLDHWLRDSSFSSYRSKTLSLSFFIILILFLGSDICHRNPKAFIKVLIFVASSLLMSRILILPRVTWSMSLTSWAIWSVDNDFMAASPRASSVTLKLLYPIDLENQRHKIKSCLSS